MLIYYVAYMRNSFLTILANLMAMLAVDIETEPFRNLEELIRQDVYRYGVTGGTANVNNIKVII